MTHTCHCDTRLTLFLPIDWVFSPRDPLRHMAAEDIWLFLCQHNMHNMCLTLSMPVSVYVYDTHMSLWRWTDFVPAYWLSICPQRPYKTPGSWRHLTVSVSAYVYDIVYACVSVHIWHTPVSVTLDFVSEYCLSTSPQRPYKTHGSWRHLTVSVSA